MWQAELARYTTDDPGALALIGPAGLSVRSPGAGKPKPQLDASGLYLVALADRVRGSGRRVSIGFPPGAKHLPLLFAAASALAGTLGAQERATSQSGVLLVSPDLDLRSRYSSQFSLPHGSASGRFVWLEVSELTQLHQCGRPVPRRRGQSLQALSLRLALANRPKDPALQKLP